MGGSNKQFKPFVIQYISKRFFYWESFSGTVQMAAGD